jgi:caspase domain-containing protein
VAEITSNSTIISIKLIEVFQMIRCSQVIVVNCFLLAATIAPDGADAQSLAAPCRATARTTNLDPSLRANVSVPATSVVTGEATKLEWEVAGQFRGRDAYLVIGLPEATRFAGSGFVALPPNARAPRSIRSGESATRLIVPLTGSLANTKGSADLLFFERGRKSVAWEIVHLPLTVEARCLETVTARGSFSVDIRYGQPQIVTQDRFAEGQPKLTYLSNDGRFLLLEFADRYQVINKTTGDLLFDHAGTSPRFSHVGRYVTSFDGSHHLEILDVLAQKIVFTTGAIEEGDFAGVRVAAWMNHDATVIFGYGRRGAIAVNLPLIDGRNIFSGEIGCNACHAFGSTSMSVDFDQLTVQAAALDGFKASLIEASPPSPIQGSPPRRPKFPISKFNPIDHIEDQFKITSSGKYQDNFLWAFSDRITIAFSEVWNGDINLERQLLQSKSEKLRLEKIEAATAVSAVHGETARRMVEVAGTRVSPKSIFEKITDTLLGFDIHALPSSTTEASVRLPPVSASASFSSEDIEKQDKAALTSLRSAMALASQGRNPLILGSQITKETRGTTYLARHYSKLAGCGGDEGPSEKKRPWWEKNNNSEEPPIISADRLRVLWKLQLDSGTLFIVQQIEECTTAPLRYGDLISFYVPKDVTRPVEFKRIAASYSEGSKVSIPRGIDEARSSVGASLKLTETTLLSLQLVGRFLIVVSKDSGSAAVFEVPTMKLIRLIESMENPLDIAVVTITADDRTLVQINGSGALAFFSLSSKRLILRGRYLDDELALFDDALNYESTSEGAAYVYVRVPGRPELYSLDQFSSKLNFPGVGQRRLAGELPLRRPPQEITPPSLNVEKQGSSYVVNARSDDELLTLRVTVDGQVVDDVSLSGSTFSQEISEDNIPKGRWVSFVAEDRQKLRSVVRAFLLDRKPYPGKLNILAFGADKFNGAYYSGVRVPDLSFAAVDASRFTEEVIRFISPSYSSYLAKAIDGNKATRESLLREIEGIAGETKKSDTLILFFASHGASNRNRFSLLLPSPTRDGNAIELPFSSISVALKSSQGRIFIFLDACHSASATQDAAAEQLASTDQNVTIITASKGRQSSLENAAWGGGAFTTAVLGTLKDAYATLGKGTQPPSIESVYASIRKAVVARTHGQQTPWFRRSSWLGEQSIN